MNVEVEGGNYIIAVSGGVDSVVLLDILVKQTDLELVVTHFDHGIRDESDADARFVAGLADKYGLKFELQREDLGKDASELIARDARYNFLEEMKNKHSAKSIITAHHQDDVVETIIHNLQRGTGRRGLVSLNSNNRITRPLLNTPKKEIYNYATENKLEYVEDETNRDLRYTRNKIRSHTIPLAVSKDKDFKAKLLDCTNKLQKLNPEIDKLLEELLDQQGKDALPRSLFINTDSSVAKEIILYVILDKYENSRYDRTKLENTLLFIKTALPGKTFEFSKYVTVKVDKTTVYFT